jgi:hypothetical protein
MPYRLDPAIYGEFRAKAQFTTSASMPYRVYQACLATGVVSNTRYYQEAVCEKLSKDLGIPLEDLLAELPRSRGPAAHLYDPTEGTMCRNGTRPITEDHSGGVVRTGPANTIEEVR